MRLSFPLLLLIVALAAALPVQAQPSPVANAPLPASDLLRANEGAEPDTTNSWRYYPLAVGNVWESEDDEQRIRRRTVEKDTIALGRQYFIVRDEVAAYGEITSSFRRPLRFDTTSATVRALLPAPPPPEDISFDALCPFDAPFDTVIECAFDIPYAVTGTYEGVLVFGGASPGTGTDTVRTAVKRYVATQIGFEIRYGADIGIVYEEGDGFFRALTYYRIGEEEHGVEQFPVADEPGPSGRPGASLEAWPNPFRERLAVTLDLPQTGAARLEVVDVLGRVVRRRDLGVLPPGRHEVQLRTADLAAGLYLVRLVAGEALRSTRTVTRLR